MTKLQRGTLKVTKKGQGKMVQVLIDGKPFNLAEGQLSSDVTPVDGMEVEFIRVGGQPRQVRAVGRDFVEATEKASQSAATGGQRSSKHGAGRSSQPQPQSQASPQQGRCPADFHNPYNFIPAPPRDTGHPHLGDGPPVDHDEIDRQRYTGRVRVRMIVNTPVLVPDTDVRNVKEDANGHKTFGLRVDESGLPAIPASSVRGMLRSAFEAITNSRFGRFSKSHRDRLAFRADASDSLRLIPARIADGRVNLLTGTSQIGHDGRPEGPMYAAWLPRYRNGRVDAQAVRSAGGELPQHGDEVVCWLERMRHFKPNFTYWRVRTVAIGSDLSQLGNQPNPSIAQGKSEPCVPSEMKRARGWVCVTNANINRKHDERLFFVESVKPEKSFLLTEAHRAAWRELIGNYQATHEDDLKRRRARKKPYDEYLGGEPGQTAWSRHVYSAADKELADGTLFYARLDANKNDVEALFPVMIARTLYSKSPWDLLHATLHPARSIDELSPADRVFGWVRTDVDGSTNSGSREARVAARGLLRVGPVECLSDKADAVESFAPPGVPLAILAAPKPQQGRFYVARSPNGEAQGDGLSKVEAGYSATKGLRGRKVYPHHNHLPAAHWNDPTEDRTQHSADALAPRQEYRRPQANKQEQRDDQNRSMLGWVKPGAEFTFDVQVQNLSEIELGALLWLLKLPPDHFFRLGGGKPLGFGSVRLSIDECDVRTADELRARYTTWDSPQAAADPCDGAIQAFMRAIVEAYAPRSAGGFFDVSFVNAFLIACQGYRNNQGGSTSLPIHYPRATDNGKPGAPSSEGESFKWFVANDKQGARYALPDLASGKGLPTLRKP